MTRVMREHGYRGTRRTGRNGARPRRTAVPASSSACLVPLVERVYFSAIFAGAAEALYEQNIKLMLTPTLHQHEC